MCAAYESSAASKNKCWQLAESPQQACNKHAVKIYTAQRDDWCIETGCEQEERKKTQQHTVMIINGENESIFFFFFFSISCF